jgi:hypothetical protein
VAEYVDPDAFVGYVSRAVKRGRHLAVVLQLPGRTSQKVTDTAWASVAALASSFAYVDAEALVGRLERGGFSMLARTPLTTSVGKEFLLLELVRS